MILFCELYLVISVINSGQINNLILILGQLQGSEAMTVRMPDGSRNLIFINDIFVSLSLDLPLYVFLLFGCTFLEVKTAFCFHLRNWGSRFIDISRNGPDPLFFLHCIWPEEYCLALKFWTKGLKRKFCVQKTGTLEKQTESTQGWGSGLGKKEKDLELCT